MDEATHRHRWEDISERPSQYTVQRCNGMGGCGTIRRIGKIVFPRGQSQTEAPPDAAWEVMFQGEETRDS
jgi:hypothetical protein